MAVVYSCYTRYYVSHLQFQQSAMGIPVQTWAIAQTLVVTTSVTVTMDPQWTDVLLTKVVGCI